MLQLLAQSDIFGEVTKPDGVAAFDAAAGGGDSIGLLLFISNMIKLATVIAGIWVLFNLIVAGYEYITGAGDSGKHKKVRDYFTMSVIGLVIIASAYTIIALLGLLIFGDAGYILDPTLQGPESSTAAPPVGVG